MTATMIDNSSTLRSLNASRQAKQTLMREILARAGTRPLRPDEKLKFDSLQKDVLSPRVEILESRVLAAEGIIEHLGERANLHWGRSSLK